MSELCEKCKNLVVVKLDSDIDSQEQNCLCGIESIDVIKCSHFEEKPEDTKSKPLVSARLSTSCEQPSNHGRTGKMPRKQPKKKGKVIVSVEQGKLPSQLLEEAKKKEHKHILLNGRCVTCDKEMCDLHKTPISECGCAGSLED